EHIKLLTRFIRNPHKIYNIADVQKIVPDEDDPREFVSRLVNSLKRLPLSDGLTARSAILRDKIKRSDTGKWIDTEVYLNTVLLRALSLGRPLDNIRTEHWGEEFVEPEMAQEELRLHSRPKYGLAGMT